MTRLIRMLGKTYEGQRDCGLARALEVVGERWSLLIVRDALFGVERFGDFVTRLQIPRAVLTERLRTLVGLGVLERLPDPGHHGRWLYRPTPAGRELWPAMHALTTWGAKHSGTENARIHRHATCGSELLAGGGCPRCGVVALEDVETERTGPRPADEDPVTAALRGPRRMLEPLVLTGN